MRSSKAFVASFLVLFTLFACTSGPTQVVDGYCETKYIDQEGDKGRYKGYCKNSVPHGKGEIDYFKEDHFSGNFQNGLRNGFGTYTWASGNQYRGEYKNDKRNGQGTITWISGNSSGESYQGHWKEGARHGHGEYRLRNGGYRRGEFQNNKFVKGVWNSGFGETCQVPDECQP